MEYDDMLDRAVGESPEASGGESRFDVPTPEVRQEGSVTVVENFPAVADRLARDPEHLLRYLQEEVGTAASIDDVGRARLTGSFKPDRIEGVVDEYVRTYVRCPDCGLPDTHLETDGGTTLLVCEACGARSTVDD
ncbi:translation initiation factor IF-2 subunit beta [Candidatus Halobonum tyrrellensis]|uniref:Translation initiation factor IF-2 subunit beta n=1 Tax=Candidatus Halobonum tyrrellensis G22 TaxID=1324957 RepID=V4HAX8_9EURY|nr:translation initiation factor IF-2 subunit beta [Candidatus Halobonum tyrrellensis]ESP87213.1 translation initiation factor IF-2 subunit beta [Candidatus Halobonum tyrrellensis G22]